MFLRAVNFATRWRGVAVWTMLCLPAAAQQTIQVSKPADQDSAMANADHKLPSAFNAPTSLFDHGPAASFDVLPGSPQPVFNPNATQWQKVLENRKNWALMTPEQILGVPTPETILGVTDPQEEKLSPEERYLQRQERQERQSQKEAANVLQSADARLWHSDGTAGPFQTLNNNSQFPEAPDVSGRNPAVPNLNKNFSPFFNQSPKNLADMNRRMDSPWASPFESPEPLPKTTPEQLAGMERFRALLMQSSPAPEKTPAPAIFSSQPATSPDPFLQPLPAFNPAGHSFATFGNDISKPVGLAPLAGVSKPFAASAQKAPLVLPPPWLSSPSPQNPNLPQRQF